MLPHSLSSPFLFRRARETTYGINALARKGDTAFVQPRLARVRYEANALDVTENRFLPHKAALQ